MWWTKAKEEKQAALLTVISSYISGFLETVDLNDLNFPEEQKSQIADAAFKITKAYIKKNNIYKPSNYQFMLVMEIAKNAISDEIGILYFKNLLYEDFFAPFAQKNICHTEEVFKRAAYVLLSMSKSDSFPEHTHEIETLLEKIDKDITLEEARRNSARYCLDIAQ